MSSGSAGSLPVTTAVRPDRARGAGRARAAPRAATPRCERDRVPAGCGTTRRLSRAESRVRQARGARSRREFRIGPDAKREPRPVGGAYDYSHNRLIIVPRLIQTRHQLDYTLAHELTHALEDQRFRLRLATLGEPERAFGGARRAVIEGTRDLRTGALPAALPARRVPIAQRLEGMRSVIAAAPGRLRDQRAGRLRLRGRCPLRSRLYRRAAAGGGWSTGRSRRPRREAAQMLHPRTWPGGISRLPIRLQWPPLLRRRWRPLGSGVADEEQALGRSCSPGGSPLEASAGGLRMGRRQVRGLGAAHEARASRLRARRAWAWSPSDGAGSSDVDEFSLAVPAYMVAGLLRRAR